MTKDGNKKAEELDRLIRETQRRRKSDDFPAHGDSKEGERRDASSN
jgi:hypothetical protein